MLAGKMILEFNMEEPEQREEAEIIKRSRDFQFALSDICAFLREFNDYGTINSKNLSASQYKVFDKVQGRIYEIINERGISELV